MCNRCLYQLLDNNGHRCILCNVSICLLCPRWYCASENNFHLESQFVYRRPVVIHEQRPCCFQRYIIAQFCVCLSLLVSLVSLVIMITSRPLCMLESNWLCIRWKQWSFDPRATSFSGIISHLTVTNQICLHVWTAGSSALPIECAYLNLPFNGF